MPYGLPAEAIEKLSSLFRSDSRIEHVWLYGSRALGSQRPASDIDISLEGSRLTFADLARFETQIDDLLLPWKVDLSLMHHVDNRVLLDHIRSVGRDLLNSESSTDTSSRENGDPLPCV